jgi:hypothetical protein
MFNLATFVNSLATLALKEAEEALLKVAAQAGTCAPTEFTIFQQEALRRQHMWAVDAHISAFPAWSGEDYRLWRTALAKANDVLPSIYGGIVSPMPGERLVHRTCTHRTVYAVLPGGVLVVVRAEPEKGWLNDVVGGRKVQTVVALRGGKVLALAGSLASEEWVDRQEAAIAADRAADEAGQSNTGTWEAYLAIRAEQDGLTEGDCDSLGLSWGAIVDFQAQSVRRKANIAKAREGRATQARQEEVLASVLGRPMPQARR